MDNEKLLYKVHEAAAVLNVSRAKVYQLVTAGVIPSVLLGGCRRIPVEGLRQFVADQTKAVEDQRR